MEDEMISFAGVVQGAAETAAVTKAIKSKWHASGHECQKLEEELATYTGAKYCAVVNSGSSANLLSLAALNLDKDSKVLTSGCGFPATLNPILHLGLTPVLVDYSLPSHNIDLDQVEDKLSKDPKIKAIIFAHTLGNPVDMNRMTELKDKYGIHVIEDCCEALGSTFDDKHVGTFGTIGTFSFYPSHQINGMGTGGAIITDDEQILIKIKSMRAWGKVVRGPIYGGDHISKYNNDVHGIPYDDQFTYSTCGWNMQFTDVNAAYTRVQMTRLPAFVKQRVENYHRLRDKLANVPLIQMRVHELANPAYFGYPITFKAEGRDALSDHLLNNKIKSRPFFAGNITRHPAYIHLYQPFEIADYMMTHAMFVGVWQGLKKKHMDRIANSITEFFDA